MDNSGRTMEKLLEEQITWFISLLGHNTENVYPSPQKIRHIYKEIIKLRKTIIQMNSKRALSNHMKKAAARIERGAIHFLLERCYWVDYQDSEMVGELLKMLFEVDGHLGKIFDFQRLCVPSRKRSLMFAGVAFETSWTEQKLSSKQKQPYVYFLEQTNKAKILFAGQRLADRYIVRSIQYLRNFKFMLMVPPCSRTFICTDTLVKLLEYGLFANSGPYEENIGKLLTGIIGVILCSGQNPSDQQADYARRIINAGNVLLRAIPHVQMSGLLEAQKLTVRHKENMTASIVQQMSVPTLLPQLKLRCTGPQDLQHLCRIKIRRVLYDNWKLPQDIVWLPLPVQLKDYINLKYD